MTNNVVMDKLSMESKVPSRSEITHMYYSNVRWDRFFLALVNSMRRAILWVMGGCSLLLRLPILGCWLWWSSITTKTDNGINQTLVSQAGA